MARGSGWGRDSGERTSDGEEDIVGDLAADLSVSEAQRARIRLRERWELASVLSFLRVFRPLIADDLQLSAEEIERALISPNEDLGRIHIALLKVAEGEIPLKADNGSQDDILKYIADELKKGTNVGTFRKERMGTVNHGITYCSCVVRQMHFSCITENSQEMEEFIILVETLWVPFFVTDEVKENIIDIKMCYFWDIVNVVMLLVYRCTLFLSHYMCIGRYEGDLIIGHRLYREISKIESKQKAKGKSCAALPPFCSRWDTVATNLEEFQKISDNLSSNEVAGEAFIGGIVKTEILPILQKLEKKKARALKQKQRQIQQLEGLSSIRVSSTRSCRKRRLVRYTFDEYDRTIDEAIEISTDHDVQDDENDDDYVKYQDQKPDRYHAAATKKRLRERPVRNAECSPLIILDSEDENPAKAS
ncbi:hypothetical protein AXF42_Ash011310 [Apostasia shenzhenica]|uniref:DDT domain-containing protein n=1 Tax=Apostasia shenzhenica TaxID=1088818 RepID=A0A2I0AE54_9ASPA|nr:hypothetical protein AXF42_Ash011310 [Apostasia shenzhenica]